MPCRMTSQLNNKIKAPSTSWDGAKVFKHKYSNLYITMPRNPSGEILKLEVRITPPDQKDISEWYILEHFVKLIIAKEGEPNGKPKLHYHIYLETTKSLSYIRSWVNCVLQGHYNPDDKINGNSMYFTRKPHDNTIPYIIKSNNILHRIGYTQQCIDEFFKQSEDYVKSKERQRKRQQRSRVDEMKEVFDEVEKDLKDRNIQGYDGIVSRCLAICHSKGYDFPTRQTMEKYVLRLMYSRDEYLVRSFYTKTFDNIRT